MRRDDIWELIIGIMIGIRLGSGAARAPTVGHGGDATRTSDCALAGRAGCLVCGCAAATAATATPDA